VEDRGTRPPLYAGLHALTAAAHNRTGRVEAAPAGGGKPPDPPGHDAQQEHRVGRGA
jgi:hypothetical protein